jgi:hypothetical protein
VVGDRQQTVFNGKGRTIRAWKAAKGSRHALSKLQVVEGGTP